MERLDLVEYDGQVYRFLGITDSFAVVINCFKNNMPEQLPLASIEESKTVNEDILSPIRNLDDLSPEEKKVAYKRYTAIAGAVSVVTDKTLRCVVIDKASEQFHVSKQSLRHWLCQYLIYQNIAVLAPKEKEIEPLTKDQKNMRWALNKYFYTSHKNSLKTAYTMMLKEKYCLPDGTLCKEYPSFNQFRYFYYKTRSMENFCIKRNGLSNYQRNSRPLLGDGVQEYAPLIGTAMIDSTICDIYLKDETGCVIGRPVLVAACDTNTSMCMGYSLGFEGGTNSIKKLLLTIVSDKVELCRRMGIAIKKEDWNIYGQIPSIIISDRGTEYTGQVFEQVSDLGVTIINLPPYRPELKGPIEKLFDLIQSSYKDSLKGKGVINPDYLERGAPDYRSQAKLTINDFERIIVKCIVFYNCNRIIENYPYSERMLAEKVRPYAASLWNWKKENEEQNLITVSEKDITLVLLPRTTGKYTRGGLIINRLRYSAEGKKKNFLEGGEAIVSYNPDNCNMVFVKEKDGSFTEFKLIESRFKNMSLNLVQTVLQEQKDIIKDETEESIKARIDLIGFIESVSESTGGIADD